MSGPSCRGVPAGDCFCYAYRYVQQHPNAILVHAEVLHPWDRFWFHHAWAEDEGVVHDWQTDVIGGRPRLATAQFYENWRPRRVRRFDRVQATTMLLRQRHHGPWL